MRVSRPTRDGPSTYRQHHGLCLHQEEGGHTLPLPVQVEPLLLARSGRLQCAHTRPVLAVVSGQSGGRFSVLPGPDGLGFPALSLSVSIIVSLDAFVTSRSNLLPRYMTWERDKSVVGQNCLNYLWDPVTWLFPPVPLISAVLREVEEQQIEAIIICPGWERALWWHHLSKMLVQPIWWLPASRLCLSYPDSTKVVEFSMDPLVAAHIRGSQ